MTKYDGGQPVMLGDVVTIGLKDGAHRVRVVLLGETQEHRGLDANTAKWVIESGHVGKSDTMAAWVDGNPLAHNDPRYGPVADTISTCLCGVALIRREEESQQAPCGRSPTVGG